MCTVFPESVATCTIPVHKYNKVRVHTSNIHKSMSKMKIMSTAYPAKAFSRSVQRYIKVRVKTRICIKSTAAPVVHDLLQQKHEYMCKVQLRIP